MTLEFDGKTLTTTEDRIDLLKYWIQERLNIMILKEAGAAPPWSRDPIFQRTYFCNVQREEDRVTKWIRNFYSGHVADPMFEVNIVFSRLINWPPTLEAVGYLVQTQMGPGNGSLSSFLSNLPGKVFGDAYIVSTNGRAMPKAQYLCEMLLPAAYERLGPNSGWRVAYGSGSLAAAYKSLGSVYGLGSFMAGQILADLKNTEGYPLQRATDWWTFAVPGPGSLRGISWILYGDNAHPESRKFERNILGIRDALEVRGCEEVKIICNQDLQNCLCEFDKYCRVKTGVGRSKRTYQGV